jgi:hypothetical protein
MSEIPSADALDLFSAWQQRERGLVVVCSNPCCAISLRNAHVTICLDDLLQLTCGEEGIARFFVRGALFSASDPKDFPSESSAWSGGLEAGIRIRFVSAETECFVFPERQKAPAA